MTKIPLEQYALEHDLHKETVRLEAQRGKPGFYRIGRKWFWSEAQLLADTIANAHKADQTRQAPRHQIHHHHRAAKTRSPHGNNPSPSRPPRPKNNPRKLPPGRRIRHPRSPHQNHPQGKIKAPRFREARFISNDRSWGLPAHRDQTIPQDTTQDTTPKTTHPTNKKTPRFK